MTVLFKLIYFFKLKLRGWKFRYGLWEVNYLYPERVYISTSCWFTEFPEVHLDSSRSKILLKENVSGRSGIRMLAFENGLLQVGPGTFFNNLCSLNCLNSITIGENCIFGEGVKIYDHNHNFRSSLAPVKEQGYSSAPVTIEDNCWIGSDVIILKGVTIGRGSVIGAGCLIHKSIPAGTVVYKDISGQTAKSIVRQSS